METCNSDMPLQAPTTTKNMMIIEVNFLTQFGADKSFEQDPASHAQPDFHTHYSESHLLDAALPAHKIFGIFDEALPISTRGRPKGSKNKKKPTFENLFRGYKGRSEKAYEDFD